MGKIDEGYEDIQHRNLDWIIKKALKVNIYNYMDACLWDLYSNLTMVDLSEKWVLDVIEL